MQLKYILILGLMVCCTVHANAAQQGVVVRGGTLKAAPSFSAKALRKAELGSSVILLKRKGGWLNVSVLPGKQKGWLRTYQIRTNVTPEQVNNVVKKKESSGGLASLSRGAAGLFSSKRASRNTQGVANIGLRGLSKQEIEQAAPDNEELKKLDTYQSDKATAQKLALKAGLKARKVAAIPKPKKK